MVLALSLLTKIKHIDKDYECWKYSNGIAFNPSNNDTYTANLNLNTMAKPSEQILIIYILICLYGMIILFTVNQPLVLLKPYSPFGLLTISFAVNIISYVN